jgi:hypothetical protein
MGLGDDEKLLRKATKYTSWGSGWKIHGEYKSNGEIARDSAVAAETIDQLRKA